MKYTYTLDTLPEMASKIVEQTPHKTLLFKADLGVGKTTLIKELAKAIGIEDEVSSPTFSIVNEYQGPGVMMYHFDFYRIEEYFVIGFHWHFWFQQFSKLHPMF